MIHKFDCDSYLHIQYDILSKCIFLIYNFMTLAKKNI